jgi:CheY-like chemotaxis protein
MVYNPATHRLRILVADDDADTAVSLATLLHLKGHEVHVALTGPAALETAKDNPPDVVLLDLAMPGMDGYELAARLREQATDKWPLLIAITGFGREEYCRRSAEAGIDLHLVKPVDPKALDGLLKRFRAILMY